MQLIDVISRATEFLESKSIESARLNVELILCHVLRMARIELYTKFDIPVKPNEIEIIRSLIIRRANHEPLQYLIGSVNFFGIEIKCDKRALIPRQETEFLVESILNYIPIPSSPVNILEIGTGSGCISIALSQRLPNANILAIDISKEALTLAHENIVANNLSNIRLKIADISQFSSSLKFDIIVSNPPYIPAIEINDLQLEILNFEPLIALDGGEDGLQWYRIILDKANKLLEKNGFLALEHGKGQSDSIVGLCANNFRNIIKKLDYDGNDRCIIAHK